MKNPYMPYPVKIEEVIVETDDKALRSFVLKFLNAEDEAAFDYLPGQFAELSVAGRGEIPIGIASSPTEKGFIKFTVNKVGLVTTALHNMKPGDVMGVRGPLGNSYPFEEMKGKDIFIAAGGFAVTTLRSTIKYILDEHRDEFGDIDFVYGAREPGLLLYGDEMAEWRGRDDLRAHITIDREYPGWDGLVGFVPTIAEQVLKGTDVSNKIALVCGPPAMIRFTQPVLDAVGFKPEQVVMSLENRMKCGIGICGRCNTGTEFVCNDGPVFTLAQLNELPKEY